MAEETEKKDETEAKKEGEPDLALPTESSPASQAAQAKTPAAALPAANSSAPTSPAKKERHLLVIFGETLGHINTCEQDKSIVFRHNDRKSIMFMLAAFVLEIMTMSLFLTVPSARNICIALALLADFFFGLAILWYVLLRFGVLRSFEPRQTLLTWQLMIGAGALFAFYTMNIAFAFFTYYNFTIMPTATAPHL